MHLLPLMELNGNLIGKTVYTFAAYVFSTIAHATALILTVGVGEGEHVSIIISSSKLSFANCPALRFCDMSLYLGLMSSKVSRCMEDRYIDYNF